jgi:hypothetical protein
MCLLSLTKERLHAESRDHSEDYSKTISLKKSPLPLVDDILGCELDVNLLSFARMLTLAIPARVAPKTETSRRFPDWNSARTRLKRI